MDDALMMGLVASGTSMVVSIIGLATALLVANRSSRTSIDVERFRRETESSRILRDAADHEALAPLETLRQAIAVIQKVRDQILLMTDPSPDPGSATDMLTRFKAVREELFAVYERDFCVLNTEEVKAFHAAKNLTPLVEKIVGREAVDGMSPLSLHAEARQELMLVRSRLAQCQNALRDGRTERLGALVAGG